VLLPLLLTPHPTHHLPPLVLQIHEWLSSRVVLVGRQPTVADVAIMGLLQPAVVSPVGSGGGEDGSGVGSRLRGWGGREGRSQGPQHQLQALASG
jgi:hypothetical protein